MEQTAEDVRRHVLFKRDVERTLGADQAARMLHALECGEPADYQHLLRRARPDLPAVAYHCAPASARATIEREGLRATVPDESGRWPHGCAAGQPAGVYVDAQPDVRGVWAHDQAWDCWAVSTAYLEWDHDELNPGSWRLLGDVLPERLQLHSSHQRPTS
jgi:hypothetical protein